jgi:hypothetical protein
LNTDEAIALGAIYHAARESKNFIVKRFDVVDIGLKENGQKQEQVKPMDEKTIAEAKSLLDNDNKRIFIFLIDQI